MKYLGTAKRHGSTLEMPSGSEATESYEVLEFEGKLVLIPLPFDSADTEEVQRLARETIEQHRKTLEALAQ